MGTRATISIARREEGVSFSEFPDKVMVSIYQHFDGYPEGLGVTLASYLDGKKIVNGLGGNSYDVFNGLGCLAASLIAELKDGPGNIYIEDPENKHNWIEYDEKITDKSAIEYDACVAEFKKAPKMLRSYCER